MTLEKFTMTEIVDYYTEYLVEHEVCGTKAEAKQYFLNAITYNVVREAIVEQVVFLKENTDNE